MSADFDVVDALAGFAEDLHGEGNFAMRLHDAVKRLKEERDEARAEVERLRQAVHTRACRNQSAYNLNCVCGADEHQRDLQKLAYQRGAEAMREAAALTCELHATKTGAEIAIFVRAHPVAEAD